MELGPWHLVGVLGGVIGAMALYIVRIHVLLERAQQKHIKFAEQVANLAGESGNEAGGDGDGDSDDE